MTERQTRAFASWNQKLLEQMLLPKLMGELSDFWCKPRLFTIGLKTLWMEKTNNFHSINYRIWQKIDPLYFNTTQCWIMIFHTTLLQYYLLGKPLHTIWCRRDNSSSSCSWFPVLDNVHWDLLLDSSTGRENEPFPLPLWWFPRQCIQRPKSSSKKSWECSKAKEMRHTYL